MATKVYKRFQRNSVTIDTGKGLTEQSHKKQCDMNVILADYARTGLIKHAKQHEGRYDDVTTQDFQEAMFIVKNAENMFNALPAAVRKQFEGRPEQFLDFVQNPDNKEQMASMGILKGNDGIDINGAHVNSPVETEVPVGTPIEATGQEGATSAP
jgi:phage internal scaffolding protein